MIERRTVIKAAGAAAALFAFRTVAGAEVRLTPAAARAGAIPFRQFSADEAATLENLAETLVVGARAAGVAHFIDAQLAAKPADNLLMLRYLDVPPPWDSFYKAGLAGLDATATSQHGRRFTALDPAPRLALVSALSAAPPPDWKGPPSPLFLFAVRADAVDVVYGTVAGFEALGVPYLEHIKPETRW